MDVVCITDGKNLGKVCDLAFYFPENRLKGLFVTGCKGFRFSKSDVFIPMHDVVKIGEDVILVKLGQDKPPKDNPPQSHCPPPDKCPPQNNNCRPPCPPPNNRRNFDDYE